MNNRERKLIRAVWAGLLLLGAVALVMAIVSSRAHADCVRYSNQSTSECAYALR